MQIITTNRTYLEEKGRFLGDQLNWNNNDNIPFYQSISVQGLKEFAEKRGMGACCDLDALFHYWSTAQSILEVGAGYGRVIDYLLKHSFQKKITAVERCNATFSFLEQRYSTNKNVTLIHDNIQNCDKLGKSFDLILFLWSGIADFSQGEQANIIKKLAKILRPNGYLVIDTILFDKKSPSSVQMNHQALCMKSTNSCVYGYMPTVSQIEFYGRQAGLYNSKIVNFYTELSLERYLILLY